MRRRAAAGLALVGILVALWATRSSAPADSAPLAEARPERPKVTRFRPEARVEAPEPGGDVLLEAARGDFGEAYQERLCDLCAQGSLTGEVCELAACVAPEEVPALAEIQVDVVDEHGRPEDRARVRVDGCQVKGATRQRTFSVEAPGTCVVQAWRRDGALFARAPDVEVTVAPGGQEYVQLELASTRTGGLGVSILQDPEGIRVVSVMPGTPAEELGLAAGDVILEVNGVDTLDLDVRDFIAEMTGPEGTEVDFVVRLGDDPEAPPEPLTIVRRFLDRS